MTSHKKTLIGLVQDEIEKGATTVEEIHKAIADLPLKMLEGSHLLKGPAKRVREVQDRAIGAIYDLIREITHRVGHFASELVEVARRSSARAERAPRSHQAHAA